jgi:hypothetical protein
MGRRGGNRSIDGFASVRASINYHHLYVRSNPERDEVFSIQQIVVNSRKLKIFICSPKSG